MQNYTYAYDRYGNRWQTALQSGYNFNPTYSTTSNHITSSGYAYDAAGNMTNDAFHTYKYDAEGNILQVDGGSTATYVYDVLNQRIHLQTASATTEFIYDYAGRRVSSWLPPSNYGSEGRIYWDGQQVAYRSTDGTTYFDHQDVLGTERVRTNYAGSVGSSYVSLPWGDGYTATVNSSGADQDNEHFAGLERDAESGTEHAQFRNYTSNQGRWLVPDQYPGSYDVTNPQSMNRYAYVLNNPMSMVDPSGLFTLPTGPCDPDVSDCDPGPYPDPGDPCAGFFGCDWPFPPVSRNPGGITPVNPGQPFVFKVYTGRQIPNFALQRTLLLAIPFDIFGGVGGAFEAPNNGEPPSSCLVANIAAVNAVSNLNVNMNNVVGQPFIFNGGLDVNFSVPGGSPSQLPVGRYPSSFLNQIFGIGSSLYVPGPGGADPSTYGVDSSGNFTFTTHIDTAYSTWHTPIGAIIHYFVDVRDKGAHRGPC